MKINRNISRREYDGMWQVNACYKFPDGTAIWGNYCKYFGEYYLAGIYRLPDGSLKKGPIAMGYFDPYCGEEEIFRSMGPYTFKEVRKALLTGVLKKEKAGE